ncbi:MAG: hypothetical protein KGI05_04685 [Thaumarchaeota archaeon]|nr:hypothetical protein [Nitrososphaerota archaeon]
MKVTSIEGISLSRPFLYLNIALEEFKEEIVRCILDEMLEENGKKIKKIGLDYIRNEIEYDVTEDIKEYQLAIKFYMKSTAEYGQ